MHGIYLGLYRVFGRILGYRSDVLRDSFEPEHIKTTTLGFQTLVVSLDVFIFWLSSFLVMVLFIIVDIIDPNIYIRVLVFYHYIMITQIIAFRIIFRVKELIGVRSEYAQGESYSRNWDFVYRMYGMLIGLLFYVVVSMMLVYVIEMFVMGILQGISTRYTLMEGYDYIIEHFEVTYIMIAVAGITSVFSGFFHEIYRYFDMDEWFV